MEKDESHETNSLNSPTPKIKGPTLDPDNETKDVDFIVAEEKFEDIPNTLKEEKDEDEDLLGPFDAHRKEDVETKGVDFIVAEEKFEDIPNTLKEEKEKDEDLLGPFENDHLFTKNEKADLLVTERDNEDLLGSFENDQKNDEQIWKSESSSPTAEVNESHVLIDGHKNGKADLIVNENKNEDLLGLYEDDQKNDDVVDSHVTKKDDENKRENEDLLGLFENEQKNNELVNISEADIPKEDLKAPLEKIEISNVSKDEDIKVVKNERTDELECKTNDIKKLGIENEEKGIENLDEADSEEEKDSIFDDKNDELECKSNDTKKLGIENEEKGNENLDENYREEKESIFDGTEVPGMEANTSTSSPSLNPDPNSQDSISGKAIAVKNFVREKSIGTVSNFIRRLSGKSDDMAHDNSDEEIKPEEIKPEESESSSKELLETENKEVIQKSEKTEEKSGWNPLSLIGISRDADVENKAEQKVDTTEESLLPIPMKGRILLYTRLGCKECKEARIFLRMKKLRYVEINIDVYPSRKLELEKIACSTKVPIAFFNEILVGGLSEMKSLDENGKLKEKIDYVVTEAPPYEAPLPPLSGEDDMSTFGKMDELAVIVRKMKETIVVKDRFYKMRRFTNCFVGSEAVDFLSEDQYLERVDAVEFGRKLANGLFFQHVLEENLFEDGNHLYRFLDQDPIVMSQCYNIPRGITEIKPKPISDISSRLRFLSYAIFEAYTSDNGRHVDYRSIHGSEEFARYLRIIEELQRVDLSNMSREEKLSFFINLFNMMVIHAILILGHPNGALDRRKMLGDFKYIIGGCTYSLSAIQNGVLRANQRPPYTLTKSFGLKDKRAKVALAYPEPLIHFALVFGNRSSPPLRCYSPGDVDKELTEAARDFLRSGGLTVDLNAKVTSASKILKWYSVDFGKNEVEVLKHAANYLGPDESEAMLELLDTSQLKVVYQQYDWGLNN